MSDLERGQVVWALFDPAYGHEQSGRRPAIVVSSRRYLAAVRSLVMLVPVTTVDKGYASHVELDGPTGLKPQSFAMTEQVKAMDRRRVRRVVGRVDGVTMARIDMWLADHLALAE